MKIRFVLAGLIATLMVLEVSAQREYDDMYFTAKDREKNKAVDAEESMYATKSKKQRNQEEQQVVAEDNSNPTDSYSARNVNPEYISRENSEQASEDEANYYVDGYAPEAESDYYNNYNNSYYNNSNWARNSYYMNNGWNNSPFYGGCRSCGMSNPYYPGGFYDPWMSPGMGMGMGYGYSPYGWNSGWSISLMYGNYGNPWGGGYGMYNPYYYGGGYGFPRNYYGGGYENPRANYGKRPSRHSNVVTPTQRNTTRMRTPNNNNNNNVSTNNTSVTNNGRTRVRQSQSQDEYYVRPARRTSLFETPAARPSNNGSGNSIFNPSQPTRSREISSPSQSRPSYNPPSSSPSPSRSSGGSSGGSGGGSSPRPRGRN